MHDPRDEESVAEGVDICEVEYDFFGEILVAHIFDDSALDLHGRFLVFFWGGFLGGDFFFEAGFDLSLFLLFFHHADDFLFVLIVGFDCIFGFGSGLE